MLTFIRVLKLQEIESVRAALRLAGIKYRIIYQGPRPRQDYKSSNPSFTLKKTPTGLVCT